MNDQEITQIEHAFSVLRAHKIPHMSSYEAFRAMLERVKRTPDEDDRRWPMIRFDGAIEDHVLPGQDQRPEFSCKIVKGRAYKLSPAQRDIVRQWFNMTPAQLVEVIDVQMFPDDVHVRSVTLRSVEHIDPRRKGVMNMFTIDQFGKFMSAVAARESERQQQGELDRMTQRIEALFKKAKDQGVAHSQRTPGYLANRLHVETTQLGIVDPEEIRAKLRTILLENHEHGLAKLVKEPRSFGFDAPKAVKAPKVPTKSLEELINEYLY